MSSAPNGSQLRQRQMKRHAVWSGRVNRLLMLLELCPQPARVALLLIALVCAASLAGCGTLSTPPSEQPRNPSLPQASTAIPAESYSSKVESFLQRSRELLMRIRPM